MDLKHSEFSGNDLIVGPYPTLDKLVCSHILRQEFVGAKYVSVVVQLVKYRTSTQVLYRINKVYQSKSVVTGAKIYRRETKSDFLPLYKAFALYQEWSSGKKTAKKKTDPQEQLFTAKEKISAGEYRYTDCLGRKWTILRLENCTWKWEAELGEMRNGKFHFDAGDTKKEVIANMEITIREDMRELEKKQNAKL